MAEEIPTGSAPVVAPVEPTPTVPATTQPPQEATPTPATPTGGGKTLEQLSQEVEEQATLVREANDRILRQEHELNLARNIYENFTRGQGRPQEQTPAVPEVSDDEFLTNPAKATSKIIESYFARDKAEREQEKVRQYVDTARTAYESGKAEAVKSNPNLYRGIEADLSREVLNSVQSSLKAGSPVDTSALKNPKYWEAAAIAMRIMNGEDVSKYYERKVTTPMTPTHQETPTAGGPPQDVVTLTNDDRETARSWGFTDEQMMAQKKRSAEDAARLAR
jgi:hypothetical protein